MFNESIPQSQTTSGTRPILYLDVAAVHLSKGEQTPPSRSLNLAEQERKELMDEGSPSSPTTPLA